MQPIQPMPNKISHLNLLTVWVRFMQLMNEPKGKKYLSILNTKERFFYAIIKQNLAKIIHAYTKCIVTEAENTHIIHT